MIVAKVVGCALIHHIHIYIHIYIYTRIYVACITHSCLYNPEQPDPPVINMVLVLNSVSASLSWTSPHYNCSLNYIVQAVDETSGSVIFSKNTTSAGLNLTILMVGESYIFRVASVDEGDRMSNWSQPFSLAMKGLAIVVKSAHEMYLLLLYYTFSLNTFSVPADIEIIAVKLKRSMPLNYVTVEWKVGVLLYIFNS